MTQEAESTSPAAASARTSASAAPPGDTALTFDVTVDQDALNDLSDYAPKFRRRKLKPGLWDGRVGGLCLKEFRSLKWGLENSHGKVERRGPSYTMRPHALVRSRSGPDTILHTDVYKSFNVTQQRVPSWSMGKHPIVHERERSQGPAQYKQHGIIGSSSHPTIPKDLGRQFGRERLLVNDENMPAPGDYDTSGFERSSRFSKGPQAVIQGREAWKDPPRAPGPGCGEYQFENFSRIGKDTPIRWSAQGKTEMTDPPTGAAATRLQKRVDRMKRMHKFETELDFRRIAPILLALDSPELMDIFKKLEDRASMVRDPNIFLVSAAMQRLGNGGGYGARRPQMPGPTHYNPPGAGGLTEATKEQVPQWRFGSEHRGLT